jgi:hypothetical protein
MTKRGKQTKREAPHTPEAMKAGKEAFVAALAKGMGPGEAAELIGIGRSTAYEWKREDTDFDAKWVEAVETSLDKVETVLYNLGIGGDMRAITYILKWRRRSVYNDTEESRAGSQNNYFLNVSMEEHIERLQRLGLPVPVIEPDYEVLDDEPKAD